jgi:hypothetical protein
MDRSNNKRFFLRSTHPTDQSLFTFNQSTLCVFMSKLENQRNYRQLAARVRICYSDYYV